MPLSMTIDTEQGDTQDPGPVIFSGQNSTRPFMRRQLIAMIWFIALGGALAAEPQRKPWIQVQYVEPSNRALLQVLVELRDARVLEGLAANIEDRFKLPGPLLLSAEECGVANAFYVSSKRTIVICLELLPTLGQGLLRDRKLRLDESGAEAVMGGAFEVIALHEVGHAVIDLFSLPVLGREEDAADQISAYLLLTDSDVETRTYGVAGALWFFRTGRSRFTLQHLSDEHGLSQQREVNLACWAYGSNGEEFEWALGAARVSADRSNRCATEYQKLVSAVQRLVGKNLLPNHANPG
jgi:hypothetical protein